MFASHEVMLNISLAVACERLAALGAGSLNSSSELAFADGLDTLIRVGPFGPVLGAAKLVRVRMLEPTYQGDTRIQALRWEATGTSGRLFPALDANLVLTAVDSEHCRLALLGVYRPPLGAVGATLDRMVLSRAAAATFRSLLTRVAAGLDAPASAPAAAAGVAPADPMGGFG
ncbi:MAG TPA: hypothetical protein VMH35_19510 [Streptosporangiaceae bacterium]|nr:hypothetical protein [Streptosporangiaceae bacterium]